MPEIKNTFLAGKMNKDLDERLVPNGEYRDALNIQVSKSEGSDVGVMHNVKGNTILDDATDLGTSKVIGSVFDDQNNEVYFFITNTTTKTTTIKAITNQNNQITLDSVNGITVGDIIYGLDPNLIDHVEVSSIDTANNRVSVVFNPQGPYYNIPVATTVLKNTKLSFSQDSTKINQVRKLKIGESQSTIIIENDFLNFDRTNRIQANIDRDWER